MNANSLTQFLDTGWFTEATLYYHGNIYWSEAQFNEETQCTTFFVDRWPVEKEDDQYYHSITDADGVIHWERVYEDTDTSLEMIKRRFLSAEIFDGHSFWDVEKELRWLEESDPVIRKP